MLVLLKEKPNLFMEKDMISEIQSINFFFRIRSPTF
jgi:hypothetical protein